MVITSDERFNEAFKALMRHEGGLSNNPHDPGGETNFGITQHDLNSCAESINLPTNVKDLTQENAYNYYKTQWWDKYHYDAINSLPMAKKLFDMAVNLGSNRAHKIAQESCNYLGYNLKVDGILGGKTIGEINEICLHGREDDLMMEICDNQSWYYEHLVQASPDLKVFLNGWLKRAEWDGS